MKQKSVCLHRKAVPFLFCMLACIFSVHAENIHYGDYTLPGPGTVSPDLVIINGNLDLKDTFTVDGDLKIFGGWACIGSDNVSTKTVDLYVRGDLIITNTNGAGNQHAYVTVKTGRLFVTGEIFTRSVNGDAFVNASYGIKAGRIETSGEYDCFVTASTGSIIVEEDIVTRSRGGDAKVVAGQGVSGAPVSYDIRAAAISTWGPGETSAYVEADGSIKVRGEIVTKSLYGPAYVRAAGYYPGPMVRGIEAGSIFTDGYGDAYVLAGNEGLAGFIDVEGDIVTTSSWGDGHVYAEGFIKADNISTGAHVRGIVVAQNRLNVQGDIATKSNTDLAYVSGENIFAKSITTDGFLDSYVRSDSGIMVTREIVTKSRGTGHAYVDALSAGLRAGNITTYAEDGNAYVKAASGPLHADGTIITKGLDGQCHVLAQGGPLKAGSIFTDVGDGVAYVQSASDFIDVKDDIRTRSMNGSASVSAQTDINARSIATYGGTGYVLATDGSISVVEDIDARSNGGDAYVKAPLGDINAQKIRAEAPTGFDDSIQAAAGTGHFSLIPAPGDVAKIIKDSEFSFDADHEWKTQLTIMGTCTINGNGHKLTFGPGGQFLVGPGATLLLRNIKLNNVTGTDLACDDDTGTLKLRDVEWNQIGNTSFSDGALEIYGDVVINGPNTRFTYVSSEPCTIMQDSRLVFGREVVFRYFSLSTNRLVMIDETSMLNFDGATFEANETVRLTKGTLAFDNYVLFSPAFNKKIIYGNGVMADNINFAKRVGSFLEFGGDGTFQNDNV